MSPANFCHHWCQFLIITVTQVRIPHSPNVSGRKSADAREFGLDVFGELFDDGFAPTCGLLAIADQSTNIPVKPNQFFIDGFKGFVLSRSDAVFDIAWELAVISRNRILHTSRGEALAAVYSATD